jgi:protein-tyrosine phosphatase
MCLTVCSCSCFDHTAARLVCLHHPVADCLYDIDIPSDVSYLHVQLVAKELPPLEFVREVARAANNFWAQQPDMYIAVHCAYGALDATA